MKNNYNRLLTILIAIIFIWLFFISFSSNQKKENQSIVINEYNVSGISTDLTSVVEQNKNSVVTIQSDGSLLSGFVYKQEQDKIYILTAYHGVANANNINVLFGSSYSTIGTLVGFDIYTDLAVLQIESPYTIDALKLGDASLLKSGEFVISIGTPTSIEYAGSVQLSMISLPLLSIENSITYDSARYNYYLDVIQLGNSLKTGYSGSPVLNMVGEVVGMNTMTNLDNSFAISANEIRIIADKIINQEQINRNIFGFNATLIKDMPNYEKTNLNLDIQTISGMYIRKVDSASLAEHAQILVGDVVVKINDIEINNFNDYLSAVYNESEMYSFEVLRNNQTILLGVTND